MSEFTISDRFGYVLSMEQRYHMIRQTGFDGVMLWWSEAFEQRDYLNTSLMAHKEGLFIENIHAPFVEIDNFWRDNLLGDALTGCFLQCVVDCDAFEIPTMVMHLSSCLNDLPPLTALGLDRMKRIAEMAERHGVNVALENLLKNDYISFIFDHIDSPNIGFCYDSGHHNFLTPNEDLLSQYSSRLMALHLHDNDGDDDQHILPFDGTIGWPATMKKITEIGYSGSVALLLHYLYNKFL